MANRSYSLQSIGGGRLDPETARQLALHKLKTLLMEKQGPVSVDEFKAIENVRVDVDIFIQNLKHLPGSPWFNEKKQIFEYIPQYQISNIDQLKEFILKHPEGIKEDKELLICYKNLPRDLELLKKEGWIRIVKINRDKETILFPIDLNKPYIECRTQHPAKILKILQNIWNSEQEIESIDEFRYDQILQQENLLSQFEKEQLIFRQQQRQAVLDREREGELGVGNILGKRRQRARTQLNDHLDLNFLDVL